LVIAMSSQSNIPAEDGIAHLRLARVFEAIDFWLQRQSPDFGEPVVASSLGDIDRRTAPYQVSHAVKALLASAVDHLHTLRNLTVEAEVLHRSAPTLIRPAIENASVAIWILSGEDRKERIIRRLRLQWANYNDAKTMQELLSGADASEWLDVRRDKLRAKAVDAGLDSDERNLVLNRIPGYSTIVRKAGNEVPQLSTDTALICWRACSGISHADTWATFSINQVDVISQGAGSLPEGVVGANISANEQPVESMTIIAARMIQHAWSLYDLRARPWLQPPA
jgi:hypothetical protein